MALCIFFCQEYSEDNAKILSKKLEAMKVLEICYTNDPNLPMLMSLIRIQTNSSEYHKYSS
ncbi:hypothetical protein BD408DRAFT_398312 [Parasitella parasitica]|nr:hypothetical protein BD408DRAFT_398312 [Parasitella parasitica]